MNWVIIHSTLLTANAYIWFAKLKRTNHNESNSGRLQIERWLIIFRCTAIWGSTCTLGHLILGVLAKFSGVYYSCTPVNGSPAWRSKMYPCPLLHALHSIWQKHVLLAHILAQFVEKLVKVYFWPTLYRGFVIIRNINLQLTLTWTIHTQHSIYTHHINMKRFAQICTQKDNFSCIFLGHLYVTSHTWI